MMMKLSSSLLAVPFLLVANSNTNGSSSYFGCHAAFLPSSISIVNVKGSRNHEEAPYSSALYLDNLPKTTTTTSLPNMDGVKDKLANLSKQLDDMTSSSTNNEGGSGSSINLKPSPPPPFDTTNPEALIAITKSFIATDFGIQSLQLPNYSTAPTSTKKASFTTSDSSALPFYSASLLSSNSFTWISGNNLEDGRTGILTKEEYLASGKYFDLRSSFPDLEYRAHDFRIVYNENKNGDGKKKNAKLLLGGNGNEDSANKKTPMERLLNNDDGSNNNDGGDDDDEITVRFTTLTTGTFRGASLRLRSMILEPNGKVMKCPPTSTQGEDRGKIIKLVTDMVLDRQVGNTNGLSGTAAAAFIGGAPPNNNAFLDSVPPLVALERLFARPLKPIVVGSTAAAGGNGDSSSYLAPFPDSVMIQLAKGVLASNFGLNDPNLLAEKFVYMEPLMGPLDKEKYFMVFSEEYNVRAGVPDLDYGLQNFRVDPYDPYRVWVDSRAKGTRIGNIGKRALPPNVNSAPYKAPPEAISFTFDDDGFCTRLTAAAVLDPLLGNTGGLGGVYGILYATGTPVTALKTRSLNSFLSRASKSLLSSVTGLGPDGWKLSDGRVVNGLLPASKATVAALPSTKSPPTTPAAAKPFFAAEAPRPTIALPKVDMAKQTAKKPVRPPTTPSAPLKPPAVTKAIQINQPQTKKKMSPVRDSPADPVTEALTSAFGITSGGDSSTTPTKPSSSAAKPTSTDFKENSKAQQLRNAAQAARAEADEAKKKAASKKAQELAQKQAAIDATLEKQKQDQMKKQQLADEAAIEKKEAMEAMKKKREAQVVAATTKTKQQQIKKASLSTKPKGSSGTVSKQAGGSTGGGVFSFLQLGGTSPKPPSSAVTKKSTPPSSAQKAKPVTQAKRSPTISLFDSFKPTSPSVPKPESVAKPNKAKIPVAKGASAPTISLFGTSSTKTKTETSAIPKMSSSKKTSSKTSNTTSPKAQQPRKKSPTLNIFGIGGAAKSTESSKNSKKLTASKSKSASSTKKATKTKSPTLSLKKSTPPKTKKSSASSAKPMFSFFGGGAEPSAKKEQSPALPDKKASSGSNNLFGGFFGGGGSASKSKSNAATSSGPSKKKTIAKKKPATVKKLAAPNGVPVLKQWKQVKDNAAEGRIFGSNSFKDGVIITTSPISRGKFAKGSVVQTKSGSKYFLE